MNNQAPLVSVIISFLNEERFLSAAVESVLGQDYANWELILVDDGSTDGSTEIAKDYVKRHSDKIIYTEHENHANKGLSASRNRGISLARGKLAAFLDADDIWTSTKLRNQTDLMIANPEAAMLCEACEYWHSWNDESKRDVLVQIGEIKGTPFVSSIIGARDKVFDPPALAESLYPLASGEAPSISGTIIRKSVLEKHSGFEEQFTGMYEDQAFLMKIYLNEPVFISSLCYHKYRQRRDSVSQTANSEGKYHFWRRLFLEWLQLYLKQNDVRGEEVKKLLKRALEPYHRPGLYYIKKRFSPIYSRLKNITGRLSGK